MKDHADRFRMWWVDAPAWLKEAYHNDSTIYSALAQAFREGLDDRDTLLLLVEMLLADKRALKESANDLLQQRPDRP